MLRFLGSIYNWANKHGRAIALVVSVLWTLAGGVVTAWATWAASIFSQYAPFSWVCAGLLGGLVASGILALIGIFRSRLAQANVNSLAIKIAIISPVNGGILEGGEPQQGGCLYPVRGTLTHLPPGHKIWILNESTRSGEIWPQISPVRWPLQQSEWEGRTFVRSGQNNVTIIAVVAPPTSDDFFAYYRDILEQTYKQTQKTFPLKHLPVECTIVARVQARQLN